MFVGVGSTFKQGNIHILINKHLFCTRNIVCGYDCILEEFNTYDIPMCVQAGNSLLSVAHGLGPSPGPSPSEAGKVCVLVDSRCISSGPEVVSALRLRHGVVAQVCSLDGCDFVVSNRMAVERQTQGELAAAHNRKRLLERMHSLQGLFERVCLILEADRTRPGEREHSDCLCLCRKLSLPPLQNRASPLAERKVCFVFVPNSQISLCMLVVIFSSVVWFGC